MPKSIICPVCCKILRPKQSFILCTSCDKSVHHNNRGKCSGLSNPNFIAYQSTQSSIWNCPACVAKSNIDIFSQLPYPDLRRSGDKCLPPSNITLDYTTTKHSDFLEQCSQVDYNLDLADESSLEHDVLAINSKYYDIDKFNSLSIDSNSSFSVCHINIASLSKHFDDLQYVMSQLKSPFNVIGISEHKITNSSGPVDNLNLDGYNKFIFAPTD